MPTQLIIVEKRSDFRWPDPDMRVITAQEFISEGPTSLHRPRKIINLCRSYSYLSIGYYVSLLAEARGDRVTPSVETIVELQQKAVSSHKLASLDRCVGALRAVPRSVTSMSIQVFFGRIEDRDLGELATRSFEVFRCPLLAIDLERSDGGDGWSITSIKPIDPRDVDISRDGLLLDGLSRFSRRPWRALPTSSGPRLDLAILHDPTDPLPPSNARTLQTMIRVGREMDVAIELIEKKDFSRLTQFDALFIRETTAVSHHTFRFAKKAASEGMPVIDDPDSILRCTNKAFLSELLSGNGVGGPKTVFVTRRTLPQFENRLSYPLVLKVPDGAFSLSVKKAENWPEFQRIAWQMLKQSDIILVQEFVYTPFDWRIGVLAGEAIFAAKYFMFADHWQIIRHGDTGAPQEGLTQAVPLEDVPGPVLHAALQATKLIGNGLYGVDLKQTEAGVLVIEVNDNPNIDVGMEDSVVGEALYRKLFTHFLDLVDAHQRNRATRPLLLDAGPRLIASGLAAS